MAGLGLGGGAETWPTGLGPLVWGGRTLPEKPM